MTGTFRADARPRWETSTSVLQGALGDLVLRPWFDWVALRSIAHGYLPLSRAWAAAELAGQSHEDFLAALPVHELPREVVRWALTRCAKRRAAYDEQIRRWESALFGAAAEAPDGLAAREQRRHRAADRYMKQRALFVPVLGRLPPVRWEVASPDAVAARHGARLADPAAAFPLPDMPEVQVSRAVPAGAGEDAWLQFRAPVLGDRAWARVTTPRGAVDPPTLISLHGIAMETEMWLGHPSPLPSASGRPLRVISPEGPWHGRRRPAGWYGGEPVIGRGPRGMIELFESWVAEVSVLIRWARRTSAGPVAVSGVSLGALTCQMVAWAANGWPAAARPDGALLIATSGELLEVAEASSLTRAVKLQPQIAERGWDRENLLAYLPLLQPAGPPAMGAGRVVMLIGASDDVTQHAGGLALARRWGLPEANLFVRPQGHFSVSLGLQRDSAPMTRLLEVLGV